MRQGIGDHAGDDGAVQRVTGRKGKGVLVRWYGVAERRSRPTDDRFADFGEGDDPATAMIIKISGMRDRHRHTINSVTPPAIRVMPSAPPRWVPSGSKVVGERRTRSP